MSKKVMVTEPDQRALLCDNLTFAASEAYKLLRVNLKFALKKDSGCPVVGVTSSTRGEGKTTTSVNLAYTLAQTGKKVLLIDGDMRLPNVARSLKISRRPGLSDCIVGSAGQAECTRKSDLIDNWDIMPAGNIPPNPSELLSSEGMKEFLEKAKTQYSFIVVDLPPVGIVSDALVLSEVLDGLMVVVREDYTTRRLLNNTISQFAPLKDKLLGFVMTDVIKNGKGYGYGYRRSRHNRKEARAYAKGYCYGYGYGYATAGNKAKAAEKAKTDKSGTSPVIGDESEPKSRRKN